MGAGYAFLPIKQVDLWPSELESGVRVMCDVVYLCVSILVFLGLSVLDLGPMYATDRRQTASSLYAPAYRGEGIIKILV